MQESEFTIKIAALTKKYKYRKKLYIKEISHQIPKSCSSIVKRIDIIRRTIPHSAVTKFNKTRPLLLFFEGGGGNLICDGSVVTGGCWRRSTEGTWGVVELSVVTNNKSWLLWWLFVLGLLLHVVVVTVVQVSLEELPVTGSKSGRSSSKSFVCVRTWDGRPVSVSPGSII